MHYLDSKVQVMIRLVCDNCSIIYMYSIFPVFGFSLFYTYDGASASKIFF